MQIQSSFFPLEFSFYIPDSSVSDLMPSRPTSLHTAQTQFPVPVRQTSPKFYLTGLCLNIRYNISGAEVGLPAIRLVPDEISWEFKLFINMLIMPLSNPHCCRLSICAAGFICSPEKRVDGILIALDATPSHVFRSLTWIQIFPSSSNYLFFDISNPFIWFPAVDFNFF